MAIPAFPESGIFTMGKFNEGAKAFLYGDNVNVRSEPAINAKVIANLSIGTPITILAESKQVYTSASNKAPWYEVSFQDGGQAKRGYVWGGLISMTTLRLKNGDLLVAGIKEFNKNGAPVGEIRLVRAKKQVSSCLFNPLTMGGEGNSYYYSVWGELSGGHGLSGVDNVIFIHCEYQACGYPNGPVVLVKSGDRLIGEIQAISVSEAGVFHVTTRLVFPDQKGGKKNSVIAVTVSETFDEGKKKYVFSEETKVTHTWDGTSFKSDKK